MVADLAERQRLTTAARAGPGAPWSGTGKVLTDGAEKDRHLKYQLASIGWLGLSTGYAAGSIRW